MKKYLFILSSSAVFYCNAQVGIMKNTQVIPSTYTFPHPSAALDVYSDDKGLLLPRINIANKASLTNNNTPIQNPNYGLLAFNNNAVAGKGLYMWEKDPIDNVDKYNKIFTFNETPKFININFTKDLKILEDAESGQSSYFTASEPLIYDWYKGNPESYSTILELDNGYFTKAEISNITDPDYGEVYGLVLPPGTYTFNLSFKLKNRTEYLTNNSEAISTSGTNANYFDVGYFTDIDYTPTEFDDTVTAEDYGSIRSETHTLTKLDKIHNINFFNTLTFKKDTFIIFSLGRMQGSSYYDAVDLLTGSNIKITKISY